VVCPQILHWALFRAMWKPDADACRADAVGACWGVIAEKYRLICLAATRLRSNGARWSPPC
jgi:hypothetical protein